MTQTAPADGCPFPHDRAVPTDFDHNSTELDEDTLWPAYAELVGAGPVAHSPRHGGYYVLSRFGDVKAALRDSETFRSGHGHRIPVVGVPRAIPIDYDAPMHGEYRRMMISALSPRRISAMQPFLRDLVRGLLSDFHAGGGGDVISQVTLPLPLRVLVEVVGFSEATVSRLRELTEAMWSVVNDVDYDEARKDIRALVEGEIARHRHEQPDDYLSGLLEETVEGRPVEDDEVSRALITLAIAGHETTMNAASSLFWLLGRDRGLQRALREDVSAAPGFVEEMLRLRTPAQNFARHTSRDVEVSGVRIPADARVLLSYAAADRDPAAFASPDTFDPSRASRAHLAFGWGVHQCIGATLARTELRLLLETLVELPLFSLDGEVRFHELQGGIHYGPQRLHLRFDD